MSALEALSIAKLAGLIASVGRSRHFELELIVDNVDESAGECYCLLRRLSIVLGGGSMVRFRVLG